LFVYTGAAFHYICTSLEYSYIASNVTLTVSNELEICGKKKVDAPWLQVE